VRIFTGVGEGGEKVDQFFFGAVDFGKKPVKNM